MDGYLKKVIVTYIRHNKATFLIKFTNFGYSRSAIKTNFVKKLFGDRSTEKSPKSFGFLKGHFQPQNINKMIATTQPF